MKATIVPRAAGETKKAAALAAITAIPAPTPRRWHTSNKKRAVARLNEGSEHRKGSRLITACSLSGFYAAQLFPQPIQPSQADDLDEEKAVPRH
jgi:hypothetical protein